MPIWTCKLTLYSKPVKVSGLTHYALAFLLWPIRVVCVIIQLRQSIFGFWFSFRQTTKMSKFIASDSHVSEHSLNHADSSTSLMARDEALPFDADSRGQFKRSRSSARRCFTKWQNWSLVATLLFLIAGLSVWAHVIILVRSFRCDTAPETDHFEPDCEHIAHQQQQLLS